MMEKICAFLGGITPYIENRKIPKYYENIKASRSAIILQLCKMIAESSDFPEEKSLMIAAEICEIGEITIDNEIVQKEGTLSESDWEIIENHPKESLRILDPILDPSPNLRLIKEMILNHHPWYKNGGYLPEDLDEVTSFGCRILATCLAYSAMAFPRYYRKEIPASEIIEHLENEMVNKYDPEIVAMLKKCMRADGN